jgi:hypothetical protein
VTPSVNVQLYACNAGADGGFAQQLAEHLSATTGGSANVFGHETAGHTSRNARGRTFRAEGGRVTLNATNYEAVFDAAFMAAETQRLAGELGVDAATLEGVLPGVTRSWMAGPGNRVGIDVRGARAAAGGAVQSAEGGGRETAAQAIGVDFEGTVRAVRSAWQGAAASRVRGALQRDSGHGPTTLGRRVRARPASDHPEVTRTNRVRSPTIDRSTA